MTRWYAPILALLVAACSPAPQADLPTPGETAVRLCEDVENLEASAELYADSPKYVGNEMPTDRVRAWAEQYPGFEEIWIDRDHFGWVAVGFSQNADERQAELADEFPDDGVVVVPLEWTRSDLESLHARARSELAEVLTVQGSFIAVHQGVVGINIGVLRDENLQAVADRFAGDPICVEGLDPADVVTSGPQPTDGDGWRLLGDEQGAGEPYATGVAWDEKSLRALTARIAGFSVLEPDVDFENEIVIWFGAVYGSSCPNIRLDDVVVEGDKVYARIVDSDNSMACTADANPHAYLVAVERSRLPAPPFRVRLDETGTGGSTTLVKPDLRPPGATAGPDDINTGLDADTAAYPSSGAIVETGYATLYEVDLSCGMEWIGEINGYQWVASAPIPDSWAAAIAGKGSVVVEVTVNKGPDPFVEVSFLEESVIYTPADLPTC